MFGCSLNHEAGDRHRLLFMPFGGDPERERHVAAHSKVGREMTGGVGTRGSGPRRPRRTKSALFAETV